MGKKKQAADKKEEESDPSMRPFGYRDPVVHALRRKLMRDYSRGLRSTAAHEGGHCVAADFFKIEVISATIVRVGEVRGQIEYAPRPRYPDWNDLLQEMVINCAGNVGRTLAISANWVDGIGGINDQCSNEKIAAEMFNVSPEDARHWFRFNTPKNMAIGHTMKRAEQMARDIVLNPHGRIAVLLLTEALLVKERLTGEEVSEIIRIDTERYLRGDYNSLAPATG